MRKLKYRVWDKKNKIMYYQEKISVTMFPEDFYRIEDLQGNVLIQPEFVELMLYTGRNDENDDEIYDGDIVSWTGEPPRVLDGKEIQGQLLEVYYLNSEAAFRAKLIHGHRGYFTMEYSDSFEVVGNIYENPMLAGDDRPDGR